MGSSSAVCFADMAPARNYQRAGCKKGCKTSQFKHGRLFATTKTIKLVSLRSNLFQEKHLGRWEMPLQAWTFSWIAAGPAICSSLVWMNSSSRDPPAVNQGPRLRVSALTRATCFMCSCRIGKHHIFPPFLGILTLTVSKLKLLDIQNAPTAFWASEKQSSPNNTSMIRSHGLLPFDLGMSGLQRESLMILVCRH